MTDSMDCYQSAEAEADVVKQHLRGLRKRGNLWIGHVESAEAFEDMLHDLADINVAFYTTCSVKKNSMRLWQSISVIQCFESVRYRSRNVAGILSVGVSDPPTGYARVCASLTRMANVRVGRVGGPEAIQLRVCFIAMHRGARLGSGYPSWLLATKHRPFA
ncbi:hypothetical protein HPB50_003755 [Hyalomma asiaticum]|uniref:Uncharacterized protein n=1 Tax=Hyalomma asiaticum TaxID=266040 RepID=A0ACB7SDU8_HYAAI|nr:hypothetical protein HPB50_003755 [Hyalomma asiaticum]